MKALILVDIQNDFLPGGALAVPHGDEVIEVANQLMPHFETVVATQDWHPPDHVSFARQHHGKQVGERILADGLEQVLWPVHCVQNTQGAALASDLDVERINQTIQKGTEPHIDSYSGFFDNGRRRATGLADYLAQHGATKVYILGLATDYCVKFTALDARQLNLETFVIEDGCRGIDQPPGEIQRALEQMRAQGVQIVHSRQILQQVHA